MRFPRRYEAAISRGEFLRLLPAAVDGEPFRDEGGALVGESGWRIRLEEMPALELGRIRLPRLRVGIEFAGWTEDRVDAFMRRFSLHFQRAGG